MASGTGIASCSWGSRTALTTRMRSSAREAASGKMSSGQVAALKSLEERLGAPSRCSCSLRKREDECRRH
eukprot:6244046-Pyramimonas_sp.AAC.1